MWPTRLWTVLSFVKIWSQVYDTVAYNVARKDKRNLVLYEIGKVLNR